MADHDLKCWDFAFDAIDDGIKTHELRYDDRHYAIDDTLVLHRTDTAGQPNLTPTRPTVIRVRVTWVSRGGHTGLREGFVCMSIFVLSREGQLAPREKGYALA